MSIAVCKTCKAKNRLSTPPEGQVPICGRCQEALPWLVATTDGSFESDLKSTVPVLVDFWADWCGPCHMLSPILEDLAKDLAGKLKIAKLNVDENPVTAERFRVQGIPMLLLFKNGEEQEKLVGALPKSAIMDKLSPHL